MGGFARQRLGLSLARCEVKRFIQTCLREWAYGRVWNASEERTAWLSAFLNYYKARWPHSVPDHRPPASTLGGNNLLQLNS